MKVIKDFDVWERTSLLTVIGNLPGGKMADIVKAARIIKSLSLSDEEKERAEFSFDNGTYKWNDNFQSEIEFQQEDWAWLRDKIGEYDGWPYVSAPQLVKLAEKLELV